jgi:predicted solute-binding protein
MRPRVCAVSYLNTVPLIWGLEHGPQQNAVHLSYALPSECARQLESGEVDIGIVPVAAFLKREWGIFRGTGIACDGPVRSILLISKVPFARIRLLAADAGSRSSVQLSRVILLHRYGAEPVVQQQPADLGAMLTNADAALIIGDPALRLDPEALRSQGLFVADLGEEWTSWTGLPMVFAVWAGAPALVTPELEQTFLASYEYGREHLDAIVAAEHARRGVTPALAREYFTRYIVFRLGEREYAGMHRYLELAREINAAPTLTGVRTA